MIYSGIDGSAHNYTITYSDATFGSTCFTTTIPSSSCNNGMCSHDFDIASYSVCPSTTSITVTVFGTNILGRGLTSVPVTKGADADQNYFILMDSHGMFIS